jgi:hypothetical protein
MHRQIDQPGMPSYHKDTFQSDFPSPFMHYSSINASVQWPFQRGLACTLCLLLGLILITTADQACAAGCHYAARSETNVQAARPGAMPNWSGWGAERVIQRYEGGVFTYYAFVEGEHQPCRGPSCNGSPSKTTFTDAATSESTRQTLQVSGGEGSPAACIAVRSSRMDNATLPEAPLLAGILRPPRA